MTIASISNHKSKILGRSTQMISGLAAIAITVPTILFAYGYNTATIEQYFSFTAIDLLIKVLLGSAMMILMFFARPRSPYLRIILGTFAAVVLAYANYGAFTETLALGDGIIYFLGSLIAMSETVEAELPRRTSFPAKAIHHTPAFKPQPRLPA